MKETINILYIGSHDAIRETVVRLINNKEGWHGSGVANIGAAMPLLPDILWHVVLLGSGTTAEQEKELRATLPEASVMIHHYGGGSGLLYAEIWEALSN